MSSTGLHRFRVAPVTPPPAGVHGDRDAYFPLEQGVALAAAGPAAAELWQEAGFGHAENAITPDLLDRIARWVVARVGPAASGTIRP